MRLMNMMQWATVPDNYGNVKTDKPPSLIPCTSAKATECESDR